MSKVRIVYVVSSLSKSGPTNQLFNLVANIDDATFDVVLVTLSPESSSSRLKDFEALGIDINCIDIPRLAGLYTGRKKLLSLINVLAPDIIHSQGFRGDYFNSLLGNVRIARIATQRNDPTVDYRMLYGTILGPLLAATHVSCLKKIPTVVTCSKTLTNLNKTLGINSRYILNGVSADIGHRVVHDPDKVTIRQSLDLPVDEKIFVWAGPFISRKLPITVIKAFLNTEGLNIGNLCLLGDGPLLARCKRLANGKPNIIFHGHVNNIDDYLVAADGFISSSCSEGMPNSVLEALACGLPIVLSDIPAHQEILELSPNVGIAFKCGDDAELTHAIHSLNKIPKPSLLSRTLINTHFDSVSMSKQYQNLYRTLT